MLGTISSHRLRHLQAQELVEEGVEALGFAGVEVDTADLFHQLLRAFELLLALSQRVDLCVLREAAELQFGEQQLAVAEDLECPARAGFDFDVFGSQVVQSGSRTESSRFVVSGNAVFDAEFHGADAGNEFAIGAESTTSPAPVTNAPTSAPSAPSPAPRCRRRRSCARPAP